MTAQGLQSSRHPDFAHRISNPAVLSNNWRTPAIVQSQVATGDPGAKTPPSTPAPWNGAFGMLAMYGAKLEIRMCRKLCEDGQIIDAVDALNLLVQRGSYVPNNLFYRVLKWCIAHKDLVLGTRIHALSVKSGYERDPFLATHLIGLYASHGRLQEAMRVFAKVSTPDEYNWAAIILAFAKHGEPVQAIHLYRQMGESTVQPNNHVFLAVLKACTSAEDLTTGRYVHGRICASAGKPNIFVQTSLIDMYAKCGSVEDARRVFDRLPHKNVVTWTALISGYAQQGMGQEALNLYTAMQQEGLSPPTSVTYLCLLQACAKVGEAALLQGKQLHAQIEQRGLQDDVVLCGSLVNMYTKCGHMEDARRCFDGLSHRNVVTWTAMIAGYAQQGMGQEALSLYRTMQQEGITPPDSVTFVCLLQACASVGDIALYQGKQLHVQIEERGLQDDVAVGGGLVSMYAKCGNIQDARRVFDSLPLKNVVTWDAMMAGYVRQGMIQEAFGLYTSMKQDSITEPGPFTFVQLLQACVTVGIEGHHHGKQLHAEIEERKLQDNVLIGSSLANMYARCGSIEDARVVFDRLSHRTVVTWNAMIAGYAQQGLAQEAFDLYSRMQQEGITPPNSVTFVSLLQACASVAAIPLGKQLHAQIEEQGLLNDMGVGGSLVNMYAKCGSVEDARRVFDSLPDKNVVVWNGMIAGYAQQGMGEQALSLFRIMQQEAIVFPDSVTFVSLLQACACVGEAALLQGRQLHAHVEEGRLHKGGLQDDVVVGASLVNMYAKCGSVEDARRVFDMLPQKNLVTWNVMIAGYAQQRMGEEALHLYGSMLQEGTTAPDAFTFASLLQACATAGAIALQQGKQLHMQIEERRLQADVIVGNSLVTMYANCGSIDDARRVFDRLPHRNVVTWTTMIAGYAQQQMGQEALSVYQSMQQEDTSPPDAATYVCLLQACACIAALPLGKQLHAQINEQGLQSDVVVGTCLVDMYAKCGSMVDSHQVFDSLLEKDIVAWGALIAGYTRQGHSEVVFDLVDRMSQGGMQPNGVTFLSLLTVCSHVGLVDKGRTYFETMSNHYGIMPSVEHYVCMVDLLGRAGYLDEALRLARKMPFKPSIAVWHSLLGACRKWSAVEVGRQAFEFAVRLDEGNSAFYVLMADIYAGAHMWLEAQEMQVRRLECGARKQPGQSWWTDTGGLVHTFMVSRGEPWKREVAAQLESSIV